MANKQKRLTREELDTMVHGQMEAVRARRKARAEMNAEKVLIKIGRGNFRILETYYRFNNQPSIRVDLMFPRDFDIAAFVEALALAGYPDAEVEWGDLGFSIVVRIPMPKGVMS